MGSKLCHKWALESITTNKASGGDGVPVELFQILKDDVVKVLNSICQQMWKTQQWPQDWKRSVFIPIPKKGNAKECSNYCTIAVMGNRWGNSGNSVRLYFLGSKITADGDCSHEIKRHLLLGRKVMTNLAYSKADTLLCQLRSV